MSYDIKAAEAAGHSIDQQLEFLAKLHNYDSSAAEKAGFGKDEQLKYLANLPEPKSKADNYEVDTQDEGLGIPESTIGAALGATLGAVAGPAAGAAVDTGALLGSKVVNPAAAGAVDMPGSNSPAAVRKWLATQTSNPYAGGKDYKDASKKSKMAAGEPIQSRGSKTPIRKGNLGINNQLPETSLPQKAAANIINAEKVGKPGVARRVAGMGVAGAEFGNMMEEAKKGNYGRAALSGLGSLGGLASQSRIKPIRAVGTGLSVAVPAIQKFVLPDEEEEVQQKAAGGKIGALETIAKKLFDPRFDKRVGEIPKLHNQTRHVEPTHNADVPSIYLPDYVDHPFVTSMSDRTDASGKLLGINNNMFERPIDLTGGQGYMFDPKNPGKTWESGKGPSSAILKSARTMKDFTGKDPIYLPWRMAPTGSDFSPMTGETMLGYAQSAMSNKEKAQIDNLLKGIIPNWQGMDHPESFKQFGAASTAARKAAQKAMDKHFRGEGGLGLGEARLAISDPNQVNAPEGGLQNVGRIFSDQSLIKSGEGSRYPYGVPGEGLGKLDREINIAQLLPKWVKERGIEDVKKPRATDMRSLQMKPYSGILTDELLRAAGFKIGGLV